MRGERDVTAMLVGVLVRIVMLAGAALATYVILSQFDPPGQAAPAAAGAQVPAVAGAQLPAVAGAQLPAVAGAQLPGVAGAQPAVARTQARAAVPVPVPVPVPVASGTHAGGSVAGVSRDLERVASSAGVSVSPAGATVKVSVPPPPAIAPSSAIAPSPAVAPPPAVAPSPAGAVALQVNLAAAAPASVPDLIGSLGAGLAEVDATGLVEVDAGSVAVGIRMPDVQVELPLGGRVGPVTVAAAVGNGGAAIGVAPALMTEPVIESRIPPAALSGPTLGALPANPRPALDYEVGVRAGSRVGVAHGHNSAPLHQRWPPLPAPTDSQPLPSPVPTGAIGGAAGSAGGSSGSSTPCGVMGASLTPPPLSSRRIPAAEAGVSGRFPGGGLRPG